MTRCILMFGMPRTGTTWIGKLFDSHPDTLYRHEPDSVRRLSLPLFPEKESAPQYRQELEQFIASMPYLRSSKVVGKQPLFHKSYLSAAALFTYRVSVTAAKAASHVKRNFPIPYRPTAEGRSQVSLVWKSIESPGRLGVCVAALPNSRAIHLIRHPCGYIASVMRGEAARRFDHQMPSAEDLWLLKMLLATSTAKIYALTVEVIKRLTPEERLAWRWVLTQEKILADIGHSERVLTVRYEEVCANPLDMTRKMFEFAGLDWQRQTEEFIQASTRTADADFYSIFKDPLASAEAWRSELAPEVIARILRILRLSRLQHLYDDTSQTGRKQAMA